ncbi:MAG: 4Fe-4S binding protein [Bacillota bacterium]|nr:4Fe-4S binding protein [Bacillota bacterium]
MNTDKRPRRRVRSKRGGDLVARGEVLVNQELCKECSLCITACPHNVLRIGKSMNTKGYHPVEAFAPERCTGCTLCAVMCPDVVLTVRRKSPERK